MEIGLGWQMVIINLFLIETWPVFSSGYLTASCIQKQITHFLTNFLAKWVVPHIYAMCPKCVDLSDGLDDRCSFVWETSIDYTHSKFKLVHLVSLFLKAFCEWKLFLWMRHQEKTQLLSADFRGNWLLCCLKRQDKVLLKQLKLKVMIWVIWRS